VSADIAVHSRLIQARATRAPDARPTPPGRFGYDGTLVTDAGRGAGSPCPGFGSHGNRTLYGAPGSIRPGPAQEPP